jgi:MoxR-like ATPase
VPADPAPSPAPAPPRDAARRARTRRLLDQLGRGLHEREEPLRLALLTAVAGESIFLLGPPGVGKSLIARRLKHAFASGRAFEYLMSRFSTPDELFGPVSIQKLKDEDRYERKVEGYLPTADVIFLDEIWKAGPAIQNALLTVLNERVYRNGDQEIQVAVRAILTASNELPQEGAGLSPLWDRFLVRCELGPIRGGRAFLRMIVDTADVYADTLAPEDKLDAATLDRWSAEIDEVEVPAEVLNTLQVVREKIAQANTKGTMPKGPLQIFDRRWKKLVRLLRTAAFLCGRDRVDLMDCLLAPHALWSDPSQKSVLQGIVGDAVRDHGYAMTAGLSALRRELDALEREVEGELSVERTVTAERPAVVDGEFHRLDLGGRSFEATRIKVADLRQLTDDSDTVTSLYDDEGQLKLRLKTRLGGRPHSLRIQYRSEVRELALETQLIEERERIPRTPHPLLVQHWDQRLDAMEAGCAEQRELLQHHAPATDADEHLFVPPELGRLVRANHDQTVRGMERLALRLEKLRFRYRRALTDTPA